MKNISAVLPLLNYSKPWQHKQGQADSITLCSRWHLRMLIATTYIQCVRPQNAASKAEAPINDSNHPHSRLQRRHMSNLTD